MEAHRRDDDDFAAAAGTVMEHQVCATDIAWASTAGLDSSTDCGGVKSESISSIIDVNDILDNSFCVTQSIVDPTSNSTTSGDHSSIMEHSHTMCTGSTTTTTTTTTTSNSFAYSAHTEPDSPLDSIAVHPSRGPPDAKHVPARKAATSSVTTPSSSHRGMKEMYMLVFDNGKLLGGKTIMAASTALFSVALVVCAVALRAKTRQAVKMPSGVLLGSIGTVVMACIVCVSYLLSPGCRRHSNILLLNRRYDLAFQAIRVHDEHGLAGIEATLEHRRGLLREGFLTTVAFIVYWLLLWGVYIGFWLAQSDWEILQELFGFLLSFRGSVVFFLWILYSNTSSRLAEVSIFTVHPPQNEHALYSCQECKFTDIRPDAFTHVRELFGVDETELISAFSNCSIPKLSEGASGSFMFFTSTGAFIVKSVTRRESAFLSSIVDQYAAYVVANPGTFITRIIGSYAMVLYGRESYFVVMENLFDKHHAVHHRYDIKGSWVDRNAEKPRRGQECTCRYCNMTFRTGNRDSCPNRAGFHEPNVVLKDMDLTTKVRLSDAQGPSVVTQLKKDSNFLCDQGIMDYSLLLGVIEVRFHVTATNIIVPDGDHDHHVRLPSVVPPAAAKGPMAKQSVASVRAADVVVGPGFFYMGVIDILQTWTVEKRLERFVKAVLCRKDPAGISALPPKPYRDRFHKKLDEIFHVATSNTTHASPLGRLDVVDNGGKVLPVYTDSAPKKFSFQNEFRDSPLAQDTINAAAFNLNG
ncbi:hypothetical protein DYB25_002563 [Aphanomyces astaci]|uniref:PIPK domain-containing protein n=1 Tax=Aphanomyces astaci TaxID=112090 RepID=A0A397AGE5_APHAT|nr:hypothetical protein DYB25_002563 [Aphanomyces astaci]